MIRRWSGGTGGKKGGYPGGKKGGGKGRRPVPILPGPGTHAIVPPRPKLMPTSPPGSMAAHGPGQWYQALIWLPQPVSTHGNDDGSEDYICYQKKSMLI